MSRTRFTGLLESVVVLGLFDPWCASMRTKWKVTSALELTTIESLLTWSNTTLWPMIYGLTDEIVDCIEWLDTQDTSCDLFKWSLSKNCLTDGTNPCDETWSSREAITLCMWCGSGMSTGRTPAWDDWWSNTTRFIAWRGGQTNDGNWLHVLYRKIGTSTDWLFEEGLVFHACTHDYRIRRNLSRP